MPNEGFPSGLYVFLPHSKNMLKMVICPYMWMNVSANGCVSVGDLHLASATKSAAADSSEGKRHFLSWIVLKYDQFDYYQHSWLCLTCTSSKIITRSCCSLPLPKYKWLLSFQKPRCLYRAFLTSTAIRAERFMLHLWLNYFFFFICFALQPV